MTVRNVRAPRAARGPRTHSRGQRTIIIEPTEDAGGDAIGDVLSAYDDKSADQLSEALENLGSIAGPDISFRLWRIDKTGKYAFCESLDPNIKPDVLLSKVKADYGGGEYAVVVYRGARRLRSITLRVAGEPIVTSAAAPAGGGDRTLELLMSQQQKSASDSMALMTNMLTEARAASDRQMTLMMNSSKDQLTMLMGLLPLIAGGKSDPLETYKALAELTRGAQPVEGQFATMLQNLQLLKDLGGGGGDNPDFFTTAMTQLGPVLGKLVERPPEPAQPAQTSLPYRQPPLQQEGAMLAGAPVTAPAPGAAPAANDFRPAYMSDPVLSVIGDDVLFMARRGYDPELAADAVLGQLEKAHVGDEALYGLVLRIQAAGEGWLADLARDGLDLTPYAAWALQFLQELGEQWGGGAAGAQAGLPDDDSGRVGGGEPDAGSDVQVSG